MQIKTKFIADDAVTNPKLAEMPNLTIKGNDSGGVANPQDLTSAEVTAMLDLATSTLQGLVPASGGGTINFLRADGTFAAPSGTALNGEFENHVMTAGEITAQAFTLTSTPAVDTAHLSVSGVVQAQNVDYSIAGAVVTLLGDLATGGAAELVAGDIVNVRWLV